MTQPPQDSSADDELPAAPGTAALAALRVGDADREAALQALGAHLTAGRISLDEYGERSAKLMVAKTFGECTELFMDLPAPHPTISALSATALPAVPTGRVPAAATGATAAGRADQRSRAQKIVAVIASLSVFVALALFFTTGVWLWFLLIPAISGAAGAIWGPDWKEPRPGEIDRGKRPELD